MTRVAVKFCGGCDPAYDRPAYWAALKDRARGRVEWVSLDEGRAEAVLIIDGCQAACMAGELESGKLEIPKGVRTVRIRDDGLAPDSVINMLLGEKHD